MVKAGITGEIVGRAKANLPPERIDHEDHSDTRLASAVGFTAPAECAHG
jgi:hypothetical protein